MSQTRPLFNERQTRASLVYILSASHSGSTLLALLLGSHPQVCTVGELKRTRQRAIEGYRCSCGEEIKTCRFWLRVAVEMARRGFPFDVTKAETNLRFADSRYLRRLLQPLHHGPFLELAREVALSLTPGWDRHLSRFQQVYSALVASVCQLTGKDVLVDSSKAGLLLKYLLRNPDLDIKVIRLLRDGRGVASSLRKNQRLSLPEAAREWCRSNAEAECVLKRLDSEKWTEVRYESLCTRPQSTLQRVLDFVGVQQEALPLGLTLSDHHVLGHRMRLGGSSEIKLNEQWRSALTVEDLHIFDSVAGQMNRAYGYQ
jgi:hypothetical protein